MKSFGSNQLKFDKTYLNELTEEPNSGVFKQICKYHIALHPAQLNDFGESIKDELGKKIGRYDESFQGIMLGYEKVKLQSELGVIGPDNCYIHLDVQACFFVFRPEIGMILKGTVTRTTKDHVGCLVYNTFNISIPKPDSDDNEKNTWLGENVAVKSEVEFNITYVDLNARLPHIRGKLRSILTSGDGTESTLSQTKSKKKLKKERHYSFSEENPLHTEIDIPMDFKEDVEEEVETRKKHKKKRHSSVSECSMRLSTTGIDIPMDFKVENCEPTAEISEMLGLDSEAETSKQRKSKLKKARHSEKHRKSISRDISLTTDIDINVEDIKREEIETESIMKPPSEASKKESRKNKHKEKHRKSEDFDVSLESLDLNSLFANKSLDFDSTQNQATADSTDKKTRRKRSQSVSQELYLDQIKLEPDSDLEKIMR